VAAAAAGASELEAISAEYMSPAFVASAAVAHGRVELARGQAEQAVRHLRRACRIWSEINLRFDLAHTRLLLARAYAALGSGDEAELEERAARAAMDGMVAGALRQG
jgi:tetratricopeptide (TPR) repeat protein